MVNTLSNALEIVLRTDPGLIRGHNEDAVFANPNLGMAILADGMGGYNAGEVASGMAITRLSSALEAAFSQTPPFSSDRQTSETFARRCLRDKIADANAAIYEAALSQPQCAGMGTTLVTALFYDNLLTVAHIGDSRLYRLRGNELTVLTHDHSLLQEQIDSGALTVEAARFSNNRNLVTRALGVDPEVLAEMKDFPVCPGDVYLLCSDGLNDMVEDEDIQLTLQVLSSNLELAATQLIQMANDNGGRDNVSVILIKVLHAFPARRWWWATFKAWLK